MHAKFVSIHESDLKRRILDDVATDQQLPTGKRKLTTRKCTTKN
jgi:hypothetical protein